MEKDPDRRSDPNLLIKSIMRCGAHGIAPDKFITRRQKGINQLQIIARHENTFTVILNLVRLIFPTACLKGKRTI